MVLTRSQQIHTLKKKDIKLVLQLKGGPGPTRKASIPGPYNTSPKRGVKRRSKSPPKARSPICKAKFKNTSRRSSTCAHHDSSCPSKEGSCAPQVLIRQPEPVKKRARGTSRDSGLQISARIPVDIGDRCNSFPSRGWGERETVGLSRVGRANKEVEIWEEVLRVHERNYPHLVPVVKESLTKARRQRAALDETLEENLRIGVPGPGAVLIAERLETLEWALSTSKFEPETQNIHGAIAAYKSGALQYSDHYTLMYAGQIVDTASSYGEFVGDRQERLDRYEQTYGPHWLWWEPPLSVHPNDVPKSKSSVALHREDNYNDLGDYRIKQGFWKRANWVRRMGQTGQHTLAPAITNIEGEVWAGDEGPRLWFESMLDSGATYPSLHTEDFDNLGIDDNNYGCQSVQRMRTASGYSNSRIYELYVSVLDHDGRQLVDSTDPVYPSPCPLYLGSLCPVVECSLPMTIDPNGMETEHRLSGILPFLACYVSSTPSRGIMYLGEDRNDVLGHNKMPGQKKWDISIGNRLRDNTVLHEDMFDKPKINFTHRNGQIIDEDHLVDPHVSVLTIMKGTPRERIVRSDETDRAEEWTRSQQKAWVFRPRY